MGFFGDSGKRGEGPSSTEMGMDPEDYHAPITDQEARGAVLDQEDVDKRAEGAKNGGKVEVPPTE